MKETIVLVAIVLFYVIGMTLLKHFFEYELWLDIILGIIFVQITMIRLETEE